MGRWLKNGDTEWPMIHTLTLPEKIRAGLRIVYGTTDACPKGGGDQFPGRQTVDDR